MSDSTAAASGHRRGLAHQFDDLGRQQRAGTLGMWIFLITEIMSRFTPRYFAPVGRHL